MLVSMHMTREPLCVGSGEDLADAARLMGSRSLRSLPVVDRGALVGILSRTDLMHATPLDVDPFSAEAQTNSYVGLRVADVMTRHVVTVRPEAPIDAAARVLDEHRLSSVIVARSGAVVGVLSRTDILRAFQRLLCDEGAARLSLVVPQGVDVIRRAVERGEVVSYAEHAHDAGRLVLVALRAAVCGLDALQEELQAEGARVLHRALPAVAV